MADVIDPNFCRYICHRHIGIDQQLLCAGNACVNEIFMHRRAYTPLKLFGQMEFVNAVLLGEIVEGQLLLISQVDFFCYRANIIGSEYGRPVACVHADKQFGQYAANQITAYQIGVPVAL